MNARLGVAIGISSSLFTLLIVFAILLTSGGALAQQGEPPKVVVDDNMPGPPAPEGQDDNAGAPVLPGLIEEELPEAVTDYMHIPGSVFVPMHSASGVEYAPWGCMYMTGPENAGNYSVVLPNGSTVTYLRLYYNDTSTTYDGIMRFAQYDDGAGGTYLSILETAGSGGTGTTTLSGLSHPIDNVNYSYVLYWDEITTGNSVQLCGFRVGFIAPIGRVSLLPSTLFNAHP